MIKWRKQFDFETDKAISDSVRLVCSPERDLAVQSGKDDADINVLVRRFGVTRRFDRPEVPPEFGDFSDGLDYQSSLNALVAAREAFDSLPASTRDRFANDPGRVLSFLADPRSLEESYELGLRNRPRAVSGPVAEAVASADTDPPA